MLWHPIFRTSPGQAVKQTGLPHGVLSAMALSVTCLLLGAPFAHAGVSATAIAGPPAGEIECEMLSGTSAGGSGFASASVGPVKCGYIFAADFGQTVSTNGSASDSWITGDLSASTQAIAQPGFDMMTGMSAGISIEGFATDLLSVSGRVSVSSGSSAVITFGVTGVSGTAYGLGLPGFSSSGDLIELEMIDGTNTETSVTCLSFDLQVDSVLCPAVGTGTGVTPVPLTVAPVSMTVNNGDTLELDVTVKALAFGNATLSSQEGDASINVDPLTLTLPDGVTFNSGVADFLSGSPTTPSPTGVPEPATVLLLGSGLLGLAGLRHRKRRR